MQMYCELCTGKGSGALRNAVKIKLREYGDQIDRYEHPEPEFGRRRCDHCVFIG